MIMIGLFVDLSLIRTRLSKQNCLWGRHGLGCLALVRMVFLLSEQDDDQDDQ